MTLKRPYFSILAMTLLFSCGDGIPGLGDGKSNEDNNGAGDTNLDDPNDNNSPRASCLKAWRGFVAARPQGLTTTYSNQSPGTAESFVTNQITESSDSVVTQKSTSNGRSSSMTHQKDDFLKSCMAAKKDSSAHQPTLEAEFKENKTVRAGTFVTNYVRKRTIVDITPPSTISVSETWTTDDAKHLLIFQKTTISMGNSVLESTSELLSIQTFQ